MRLDDATWSRARGWALWKALVTLRDSLAAGRPGVAERRAGWRTDAEALVYELIADAEHR